MNFLLLQVIAFSDEEGVRFHSTFLGSAALAGILPVTALQISDKRFPWITLSLYLLMILFFISLFMHNPFLVAWQCKMCVIIIIYRWCTSSMMYELNFCYMLKGIQESNFCNNIQGFQCLFSQPIGRCWMLIFFFFFFFLNFYILLKFCCLTLKQLWFCINQNKYVICLQSNIVCITHHLIYLLPLRLKCLTFNVSIITIQMVITPWVWPLQ